VTQRLFDDEDSPPSRSYTRDPDRIDPGGGAEREISLGAPAILGIFFALALICACFFGFGYTMGRKSAQAANADTTAATASDATLSNGSTKPAAGSLAGQPAESTEPAAQPAADNSTAPAAQPDAAQAAPTPAPTPATQKNVATPADGMIVGDKPPQAAPAATSKPSTNNQQPAATPAGTIMVQIAAVSSQDVADILTSSLQKKGYSVSVRHEPQDKLLHVQIGPFATRQEAVAMQQRVLADGFNAIVK
jgi:cell division septation protein DedD